MSNEFTDRLKNKMDEYVHFIYQITKKFPKEEIYNTTSQLKRATLSVVLNYIECFARQRNAVKKNFWEISYGSLKESQYLLYFSTKENWLLPDDYEKALNLADEIGAMLWHSLQSIAD